MKFSRHVATQPLYVRSSDPSACDGMSHYATQTSTGLEMWPRNTINRTALMIIGGIICVKLLLLSVTQNKLLSTASEDPWIMAPRREETTFSD